MGGCGKGCGRGLELARFQSIDTGIGGLNPLHLAPRLDLGHCPVPCAVAQGRVKPPSRLHLGNANITPAKHGNFPSEERGQAVLPQTAPDPTLAAFS